MTKKYRISAVFEDFIQLQVLKTRSYENIKLTTPEDFMVAESILDRNRGKSLQNFKKMC